MVYQFLYKYQRNIVDKYKSKQAFGLWTDMGTGKTPMSLALAEVNDCDRLVIITLNPKTYETITDEGSWKWWANKYKYELTFYDKHDTAFGQNPSCFIINYESLFERGKRKTQKVTLKHSLEQYALNCAGHNVALIVDESHKVKNLKSQQTTAIEKLQQLLARKARLLKTYLLTGTPFTTAYIDLYSQLKLLGCELTKCQFIDYFCIRGEVKGLLGWQQPVVGYKNLNSLFNLIHRYAITIKSEDVLQLPEQLYDFHRYGVTDEFKAYTFERMSLQKIAQIAEHHQLDFDKFMINIAKTGVNEKSLSELLFGASSKALNKLYRNPFYRNIDYPDYAWVAETSGQMWLRARELSVGFNGNAGKCVWYDRTRLDMLRHFLEQNEENYVLFYNYTPEMLEIYSICEELGYNIDVYCGEVKSLYFYQKFSELDEAQKLTSKKNIILANFASGSTGMNWQQYHHCIIFSLPVFRDWAQGIKRVHRNGQKYPVIYHIFIQTNWLDKGMYESLTQAKEYDSNMFESDLARVNEVLKDENEED